MRMPRVTIVYLPRNVRDIVLAGSDDIRTNDPRVHGQLVDERVKHIAAVMEFECAKIRPTNDNLHRTKMAGDNAGDSQ